MGSKIPQPSPNAASTNSSSTNGKHVEGGYSGPAPGETAERRAIPAPPPPPKKE